MNILTFSHILSLVSANSTKKTFFLCVCIACVRVTTMTMYLPNNQNKKMNKLGEAINYIN